MYTLCVLWYTLLNRGGIAMNYLFGGYPSDPVTGIVMAELDHGHFSKVESLIKAEYTTYFDHYDQVIATIQKVNGKGGLALYDLKGTLLQEISESEKPACYLSFSHDGRHLVTTNYHEGLVHIYDYEDQLTLNKRISFGKEAKMHCAWFDQKNQNLILAALGLDQLIILDHEFNEIKRLDFPHGCGVRHLVSGHQEHTLYAVSELSNELFVIDLKEGKICQQVSMLMDESLPSSAAAIRISKDGQHLFASTRGQDLIVHFNVLLDGLLELNEIYHCNHQTPRDFYLSDDEKYMLIAYQDSDCVDCVTLNENMELRETSDTLKLPKIVCIKGI